MSPLQPDADHAPTSERFEYFMVRLTRSEKDPERVAGLVERLGSGEKRRFETGDELLQMVGGWFAFSLNLQPSAGPRNPDDYASTHPSLGDGA